MTAALPLLPGVTAHAVLSPCGTWRYSLLRRWDDGPVAMFTMLNPSVATAEEDDRTVRKIQGFARRWGLSGVVVANIFALRSTDPKALKTHRDPIGPDNDNAIIALATSPGIGVVVAAWGNHGILRNRGLVVHERLQGASVDVKCLRISKLHQPEHPLYLPDSLVPIPYEP